MHNEDWWASRFNQKGILTLFSGDAKSAHAMHKGEHWDGFFFAKMASKNENVLKQMAEDWAEKLESLSSRHVRITHVMGVRPGPSDLAVALSKELASRQGRLLSYSIPAKKKPWEDKPAYLDFSGQHQPGKDDVVVIVDDSLDPTENLRLLVNASVARGAKVLQYFLSPFNATGESEFIIGSTRLTMVALTERPLRRWKPFECVLCKAGSPPLNLDDEKRVAEHWVQLNGSTDISSHAF